jgi:hypothetical protein
MVIVATVVMVTTTGAEPDTHAAAVHQAPGDGEQSVRV